MNGMSSSSIDYDAVWTDVYGDMQEVGPVHRHLKRLTARILKDLEYRSVMDVGCGPGMNFALLCAGREIDHVAGIDVSGWAIRRARQNLGGDFRVLDIQQGHPEGRWDLVNCSLVLEHLVDDLAALRNMRAMTGKYFLAATIGGDFERYRAWDERVGHVRNYRVGELEKKLNTAGFEVCRSIYWGYPFYSPVMRTLLNRSTAAAGRFSRGARLDAELLYYLFFLNSRRRGDLVIVTARTGNDRSSKADR